MRWSRQILLITTALLLLARPGLADTPATGPASAPAPVLPAGHPDISAFLTTGPSVAGAGTLAIHVVQGSSGGSAVAGDKIGVEFYAAGQVIRRAQGVVDDGGNLVLKGLPLVPPCQPLVKVTHVGLEYGTPGPDMDMDHPSASMSVSVYDRTEETPAWNVQMRHVIVRHLGDTLQVTDMLYLTNPSDKTWTGAVKDGKHVTLDLPLPTGVRDVQISANLRDEGTEFLGGHVVSAIPLTPGKTEMQVAYTLPLLAGGIAFTVPAPAPVAHMMVFAPADGANLIVAGLDGGKMANTGPEATRCYQGANLPAGTVVTIAASSMSALNQSGVEPAATSSRLPRILAIGSLVVVLLGGIVIFMRPSTNAAKGQAKPQASRGPKRRGKD